VLSCHATSATKYFWFRPFTSTVEPPIFACDISPNIRFVVGLEAWFTGAVLGGRRFAGGVKGIALDIDHRMI
jgi:hypothetical protein